MYTNLIIECTLSQNGITVILEVNLHQSQNRMYTIPRMVCTPEWHEQQYQNGMYTSFRMECALVLECHVHSSQNGIYNVSILSCTVFSKWETLRLEQGSNEYIIPFQGQCQKQQSIYLSFMESPVYIAHCLRGSVQNTTFILLQYLVFIVACIHQLINTCDYTHINNAFTRTYTEQVKQPRSTQLVQYPDHGTNVIAVFLQIGSIVPKIVYRTLTSCHSGVSVLTIKLSRLPDAIPLSKPTLSLRLLA